jgi:uncharacterized protein YecE (DUF72 family)
MSKKLSHANALVGCQAWTKGNWTTQRGGPTVFFPYGTKDSEKLGFYAKVFDTVEINSSFYAIPKPSAFESWYRQVPVHFKFSLKMPRDVTHVHNLSSSSFPVVEEFISRVAILKNKAGIVLIQLPASFKLTGATANNLTEFLKFLPRDRRFAIELRSPEWFGSETFDLLAEHNVALCLGQNEFLSQKTILKALELPTDFAYLRFSGPRDLTNFDHIQRPHDESLKFWAEQVQGLQNKGKECFVYLSNLFEGHAPGSAMKFRKMLGQTFTAPEELEPAPSLF